jgi:chromosome segregation ATPase
MTKNPTACREARSARDRFNAQLSESTARLTTLVSQQNGYERTVADLNTKIDEKAAEVGTIRAQKDQALRDKKPPQEVDAIQGRLTAAMNDENQLNAQRASARQSYDGLNSSIRAEHDNQRNLHGEVAKQDRIMSETC